MSGLTTSDDCWKADWAHGSIQLLYHVARVDQAAKFRGRGQIPPRDAAVESRIDVDIHYHKH